MKNLFTLLLFILSIPAFGQNLNLTFTPSGGANDGTDQGGLDGGKDTWANRNQPSENYGSGAATGASPRSDCNDSDYKSYYQFDLTSLPDVVDSVFFGVHHYPHTTYCYSNCDADFYFYYLTSTWDEMSITQSNEPSEDPTPFYGPRNISFPNDFQNQEYDITAAYNNWKSGSMTNYGFAIYSPFTGCNNAAVTFTTYSSDETDPALRPYLKVYYPDQTFISEKTTQASIIYPNPFKDQFKIKSENVESCQLTDLSGRVYNLEYDTFDQSFLTNNLTKGIYFLHITKNGSEKETIRVVKD